MSLIGRVRVMPLPLGDEKSLWYHGGACFRVLRPLLIKRLHFSKDNILAKF